MQRNADQVLLISGAALIAIAWGAKQDSFVDNVGKPGRPVICKHHFFLSLPVELEHVSDSVTSILYLCHGFWMVQPLCTGKDNSCGACEQFMYVFMSGPGRHGTAISLNM